MRRRMVAMTAAVVVSLDAAGTSSAGQDKAEAVLKEMRDALGGSKLASAKSVALEGAFAREMGAGRRTGGTFELSIALPDKMHRAEEIPLPGGVKFERVTGTNGTAAWEDMKGPNAAAGAGGGRGQSPESAEAARLTRTRAELERYVVAFLGGGTMQATWSSLTESGSRKADVLALKTGSGVTTMLFVDQANHLPLMIQYREVRQAAVFPGGGAGAGRGGRGAPGGGAPAGGAPGGGTPAGSPAAGARPAGELSEFTMMFADFKAVDGVMMPHRIIQIVDGNPFEELTLKKAKLNPPLKAELFEKK